MPDTINALLQYPEGFAVNLGSTFNNQFSAEAGFQVLGTEGALTIAGGDVSFYPENLREDNRWIVDSWPQRLEDAYYRDPKVIATEVDSRPKAPVQHFKDEGPEPTLAHFGHFFESIRTRKPYLGRRGRRPSCRFLRAPDQSFGEAEAAGGMDFARDDIRS